MSGSKLFAIDFNYFVNRLVFDFYFEGGHKHAFPVALIPQLSDTAEQH